MGSEWELSLDFKPSFTPKTIIRFLRETSTIGDCKKRLLRVEEYVKCLEEERRKVDAFKRELPLCMLLLNDVIETVKEEEIYCRKRVLEDFIAVQMEKDCREKMNWMSSAQLWSNNYNNSNEKTSETDVEEEEKKSYGNAYEYSFPRCKYRNKAGEFMPSNGLSAFTLRKENEEATLPLPDLSLLSPRIKNRGAELGLKSSRRALVSTEAITQLNLQQQPQLRKRRRCWSPELHRRFVDALQQLGGSQVATPKQIRELMMDDGLTNDEVKSHLQKYRLHTHRLSANTTPAIGNERVEVLGRKWSAHEHYEASEQSNSQSSSPQGPLHLARSAPEISSTVSDTADEDDVKSESYSWRGHLQRSSNEDTE